MAIIAAKNGLVSGLAASKGTARSSALICCTSYFVRVVHTKYIRVQYNRMPRAWQKRTSATSGPHPVHWEDDGTTSSKMALVALGTIRHHL